MTAWARRVGTGMPRAVPRQHRFVAVRMVCNAVCTSRRFREDDFGRLVGCRRVASDDIRHYFTCPVVRRIVAHMFLRYNRWPANGSLRQALFLDASTVDDRTLALWALWLDAIGFAITFARMGCYSRDAGNGWRQVVVGTRAQPELLAQRGGLCGSYTPSVSAGVTSSKVAWALGIAGPSGPQPFAARSYLIYCVCVCV